MSDVSPLPERYYILWLDAHIGDAGFCQKLKETFFTRIAPNDVKAAAFTDEEINDLIQGQSEIPVNYGGVQFTFKAFMQVESCLKYIEQIREHRILLITSSWLGQPAVEQIDENYPEILVNKQTKEPYHSIYIFCTDIAKVCEWGADYLDYLQVFEHETDLLARMTRDLAQEFLQQAKQLDTAREYEVALERAFWARNLMIHHEDLINQVGPQKQPQNTLSQKVQEIEQLINHLKREIQKQHNDYSDEDDVEQAQIISTKLLDDQTKALVICLDEMKEYSSEGNHPTKPSLAHLPVQLRVCPDIEEVIEEIRSSDTMAMIFIIIIASTTEKILSRLSTIEQAIQKIYIFGNCVSEIVPWTGDYLKKNIAIDTYPRYENLLIHLLEDVSDSYLRQGEQCALIYFDWAKELLLRANGIRESALKRQLDRVSEQKHQTAKWIRQKHVKDDLEEQIRNSLSEEDSDYVVMIFFERSEISFADFHGDLARCFPCQTTAGVLSLVRKIQLKNPIIIVSTAIPSEEVLASDQLLFYFCRLAPSQFDENGERNSANLLYVLSHEHFSNQLYNGLGEHYRETAIQLSMKSDDQEQAERLLERSTRCYQLLKSDIQKILQDNK